MSSRYPELHPPPSAASRSSSICRQAFGFTRHADRSWLGSSSCSNSSLLRTELDNIERCTPVTLPPGRFRLATKPSLHRIARDHEHDGNGRGCRLGGQRRCESPCATMTADLPADQLGRQRRQSIVMALRPSGTRSRRSGPRRSPSRSGPDGTPASVAAPACG